MLQMTKKYKFLLEKLLHIIINTEMLTFIWGCRAFSIGHYQTVNPSPPTLTHLYSSPLTPTHPYFPKIMSHPPKITNTHSKIMPHQTSLTQNIGRVMTLARAAKSHDCLISWSHEVTWGGVTYCRRYIYT